MRKSSFATILSLLFVLSASAFAADYVDNVKKGNEAYKAKDYKKAQEYYHNAELQIPESAELDYNMAGTSYQQGEYEGAVDKYTRALKTTDVAVEEQAQYNLGNTYFRSNDYQKAIESYQNALKLNSKDMDAKFNLELARKKLKEQIKPQQQNQNQNKDQQKQDQKDKQNNQQNDQNQDKNKQNQQNQNDQNQDKQNKQDQQQQQQQQKQQQQNAKRMSKEDAERILNALRDDEQNIQKKVRRETVKSDYSGKDW